MTVLVLSCNRLEELEKNIPLLIGYSGQLGCQLIVVDNASSADVQEYLRGMAQQHPILEVIQNQTNLGVAGGRNRGFAIAKGRYIVSLDDDTHIPLEIIESVPALFNEHPEAGILAFRVRHPLTNECQNPYGDDPRYLANHHGSGCAIRREIIDKLGGIDPLCRFGSEEIDLCIRAHAMGYGVLYCPDHVIWHNYLLHKGNLKSERIILRTYNNARVMHKYFSRRMAGRIASRYLFSMLLLCIKLKDARLLVEVIRASHRGRREGMGQHQQVPAETEKFYNSPDLEPDFGNIPLRVKLLKKITRKR